MEESKIENYLKKKILPDLEHSRGGFDKIHTPEIVDWLKKIIDHNSELNLDRTVLLIAAYAHDWGYSDLFKKGDEASIDTIANAKKMHMIIGEKKIKKLLDDSFFSFLSDKQKERCIHLVAVHDKKFEIKDTDELVLMEADMLSFLQVSEGKPMWDAESNQIAMIDFFATRMPKFITQYSKDQAKKLIKEREKYYQNSQI